MKTATKERTLQWICKQYTNGNISFSHKLQRPINQWSPKMKSLLIHSLLVGFPVNDIYIVEEDGIMYTLDGSQRTSVCIAYINNEFALSKETPNVIITSNVNGEKISTEYEIAGKKFKKLDEEVQSILLACSLSFCTLSEYTDDEVKEMFKRQNTSKPLSGRLLRVCNESDAFSEVVFSLATHPFMEKVLSPAQRKNGFDREIIINTFMLIATNQENDFTSFKNKDVDVFIRDYADGVLDKADLLKDAMDKLDENFDELKVKQLNIPMILYVSYRCLKDKKSFSKLVEHIVKFVADYNDPDKLQDYKAYCQSSTTSSENVRGRLDYWRGVIREL